MNERRVAAVRRRLSRPIRLRGIVADIPPGASIEAGVFSVYRRAPLASIGSRIARTLFSAQPPDIPVVELYIGTFAVQWMPHLEGSIWFDSREDCIIRCDKEVHGLLFWEVGETTTEHIQEEINGRKVP